MARHHDYSPHPRSSHYANDHRQAMLTISLLAFAAILSVVMIVWAVMV